MRYDTIRLPATKLQCGKTGDFPFRRQVLDVLRLGTGGVPPMGSVTRVTPQPR